MKGQNDMTAKGTWGVVPAAGSGSRIQPLAFSKELLPVGSRLEGGRERPRAVSEYLIERMIIGGARRICFVISPGKSDIMEYYGGEVDGAHVCYAVQPSASGLCDSIFRALPIIHPDESAIVGLPDTVWFPADALTLLGDEGLSFLLFPVERPEFFDSVSVGPGGRVTGIQVKERGARSNLIWGAFKVRGSVMRDLYRLWVERGRQDEYVGTLVNAYISSGGLAVGVTAGESYVDAGTVHGYREAMRLLTARGSGAGWPGVPGRVP